MAQKVTNDWEVVPASFADAASVTECVREAYEHYEGAIGVVPGPLLDDYGAMLREHSVWVVWDGESVVGVLVLIDKAEAILLDNVAVRPRWQGQGIGGMLIGFAEQEAAKRGYQSIQLYTHELMVENQAIYEKKGYEIFDRRVQLGLRRVYMRKVLLPPTVE